MKTEEMLHGESKNIEYKVTLPENSEKYVKTVIAFANTQGGSLIIGIEDKTRTVVGVDNADVFKIMDQVANAVSASCVPQIVPDITFQSVEGKTVIVVTVPAGANRPYYLKSKGKENGTFIRIAGTSRPADPDKIKELEYEGARISWDELTCVGYPVTENSIKKLCRDINRYRKDMQTIRGTRVKLSKVTQTQLEDWGLIKYDNGIRMASNAFALLTSSHFPFSRTQCAVFAGTERETFIDKRDFDGPLYEQIEGAYDFVLRNIRIGAKIEGLIRKEKYELPPDAIREMIINAHCHRNYLEPACIQVAVFSDRLEVTSPGGLYFGLTLEEALDGHSKQRNRIIAGVFYQMGLIESWGTGLQKIKREARAYSLSEPSFTETAGAFRISLYRRDIYGIRKEEVPVPTMLQEEQTEYLPTNKTEKSSASSSEISSVFDSFRGTKKQILEIISGDKNISAAEIAKKMSISSRAVEKNIKQMRESGVLIRRGSARGGYWEILTEH